MQKKSGGRNNLGYNSKIIYSDFKKIVTFSGVASFIIMVIMEAFYIFSYIFLGLIMHITLHPQTEIFVFIMTNPLNKVGTFLVLWGLIIMIGTVRYLFWLRKIDPRKPHLTYMPLEYIQFDNRLNFKSYDELKEYALSLIEEPILINIESEEEE